MENKIDDGHKSCPNKDCELGGERPLKMTPDNPLYSRMRKCMVCGVFLEIFFRGDMQIETALGKRNRSVANLPDDMDNGVSKQPRLSPSVDLTAAIITPGPPALDQQRYEESQGLDSSHNGHENERIVALQESIEHRSPQKYVNEAERSLKSCDNCETSDHRTEEGGNLSKKQADAFNLLDIGWKRTNGTRDASYLRRQPSNILELLDQLQVYGEYLRCAVKFQPVRDQLLNSILDDAMTIDALSRVTKRGGNIHEIYSTQIIRANDLTQKFLLTVMNALWKAFKDQANRGYVPRYDDQSTSEYRINILRDIDLHPSRYLLRYSPLNTLRSDLRHAWNRYAKQMRDTEADFLSTEITFSRNSPKTTDRWIPRVLRLPTSYLRLVRFDKCDDQTLWLPTFILPELRDRRAYIDNDVKFPEDDTLNRSALPEVRAQSSRNVAVKIEGYELDY